MFFTVPVSVIPSWRTSSVCFFFSSRSSSRTARRDSTTLPRRRLSLMTLERTCWPTREARFLTGRRSTWDPGRNRSEEHTSELQSQSNLVCRLLLEKKKNTGQNVGDSHKHMCRVVHCR